MKQVYYHTSRIIYVCKSWSFMMKIRQKINSKLNYFGKRKTILLQTVFINKNK